MATTEGWELLGWDTRHFGFATARIDDDVTASELPTVLRDVAADGARLVYLTIDEDAAALQAAAEAAGGLLVDHKLTLAAETRRILDFTQAATPLADLASGPLTPGLRDLALAAGQYSRFRLDPNFPRAAFEELYSEWIARSLAKDIARAVYVTRDAQGETGLVTVGEKNARADIGLLAVAARARSQGLAARLVRTAGEWAQAASHGAMQVVTQRDNRPACAFYRKCGFVDESVKLIYHFWMNETASHAGT